MTLALTGSVQFSTSGELDFTLPSTDALQYSKTHSSVSYGALSERYENDTITTKDIYVFDTFKIV